MEKTVTSMLASLTWGLDIRHFVHFKCSIDTINVKIYTFASRLSMYSFDRKPPTWWRSVCKKFRRESSQLIALKWSRVWDTSTITTELTTLHGPPEFVFVSWIPCIHFAKNLPNFFKRVEGQMEVKSNFWRSCMGMNFSFSVRIISQRNCGHSFQWNAAW